MRRDLFSPALLGCTPGRISAMLRGMAGADHRRDVADSLLVAQAAYQDARAEHDRERTELSRRALVAAREQLEEFERMAMAATFDVRNADLLRCRHCGGLSRADRWRGEGGPLRGTTEAGVTVRTVSGTPDWAAPYALQGMDTVTRYSCVQCNFEIAVLARDVE